jgi:hypothetical protein
MDRAARPEARIAGAAWLAAGALVALYPAFLNGFPLLFPDSKGYLGGWGGPSEPPWYSGIGIGGARVAGVWGVIVLQSVVAIWAVNASLAALGVDRTRRGPAILLTCLASQFPWQTSMVMPDVFAGLGALALAGLFLGSSPAPRAAALWAIAVFGAVVATANVLVLPAWTLVLGVLAPGSRTRSLIRAGGYAAAVLLLAMAPNLVRYGRPTVNLSAGAFRLSRLLDAGIAQPWLARHCPTVSRTICAKLDKLQQIQGDQAFLWEGLAAEMDAFHDPNGEFSRVSSSIELSEPSAVLSLWGQGALSLAGQPALGEELTGGASRIVGPVIKARYPADLKGFSLSRQTAGRLARLFPGLLFSILALGGYAAVAASAAWAWRSGRDRTAVALGVAYFAFVVLDIVVQGALVGPYPRYQVKAEWPALLFAAVIVSRRPGLRLRIASVDQRSGSAQPVPAWSD